jgi:hypothetical protein
MLYGVTRMHLYCLLLSSVMSRGQESTQSPHCVDMGLAFHFSYHHGSFLSLSCIWVSWHEVTDGFEQRVKAI